MQTVFTPSTPIVPTEVDCPITYHRSSRKWFDDLIPKQVVTYRGAAVKLTSTNGDSTIFVPKYTLLALEGDLIRNITDLHYPKKVWLPMKQAYNKYVEWDAQVVEYEGRMTMSPQGVKVVKTTQGNEVALTVEGMVTQLLDGRTYGQFRYGKTELICTFESLYKRYSERPKNVLFKNGQNWVPVSPVKHRAEEVFFLDLECGSIRIAEAFNLTVWLKSAIKPHVLPVADLPRLEEVKLQFLDDQGGVKLLPIERIRGYLGPKDCYGLLGSDFTYCNDILTTSNERRN